MACSGFAGSSAGQARLSAVCDTANEHCWKLISPQPVGCSHPRPLALTHFAESLAELRHLLLREVRCGRHASSLQSAGLQEESTHAHGVLPWACKHHEKEGFSLRKNLIFVFFFELEAWIGILSAVENQFLPAS